VANHQFYSVVFNVVQEGHTPLTVSSFKGGAEVVQLLLAHPNIDVNKVFKLVILYVLLCGLIQ